MATIEESLVALLKGDSDVNAIVQGRVYPVIMPDDPTFPNITLQRISTTREHTLEGKGNLTTSEFMVDCWARQEENGMAEVSGLSVKVRACMDGVRGTLSGVDVQAILSRGESDFFESQVKVFRRTLRFGVIFRE